MVKKGHSGHFEEELIFSVLIKGWLRGGSSCNYLLNFAFMIYALFIMNVEFYNFNQLQKKSRKRRTGRGGSREREKGLLGLCLAGSTAGPAPHSATFVKWNKY